MAKDLKISFILLAIFSSVVMAFKTLMGFFSGAGVNFVALIALVSALLIIMLKNPCVKNRVKDMFIVACVLTVLEFIVYIPVEFGLSSYNVYRGFMIYQNVLTFIGVLFFAYIAFRFIGELLNVKFSFVEFILGNGVKKKGNKIVKERKSKELENGCLEEKPNKANEENAKNEVNEQINQIDVEETSEE